MPEEQKQEEQISTKVTYQDPEGTKKPVTIQGVTIPAGDSVDLAEFMEKDKAQALAKKLSQNPYFKVEGGPDLQKELQQREQRRMEQEQKVQEQAQKAFEQEQKRGQAQQEPIPPEEMELPPPGLETPVGAPPQPRDAQLEETRRREQEEQLRLAQEARERETAGDEEDEEPQPPRGRQRK